MLRAGARPLRVLHLSDLHLTPGQRRKREWVRGAGRRWSPTSSSTPATTWPPRRRARRARRARPAARAPGRLRDRLQRLLRARCRRTPPATCCRHGEVERGHGAGCRPSDLRDGLRRRRLGRPEQRARPAQGRPPRDRAGRHRRPAHRARPVRRGRRPGRPGRRPARSASRTRRTAGSWTRWPPTASPLVLAGHTHGGQLCVPGVGALVTNCDLPRAQAKGLSGLASRRAPTRLAARLRRPGHLAVRAGAVRLPAGGDPADPGPTLT